MPPGKKNCLNFGFEAKRVGLVSLVLYPDYVDTLLLNRRKKRRKGTFHLKKKTPNQNLDGITAGDRVLGNSAVFKFLMHRELLTDCSR